MVSAFCGFGNSGNHLTNPAGTESCLFANLRHRDFEPVHLQHLVELGLLQLMVSWMLHVGYQNTSVEFVNKKVLDGERFCGLPVLIQVDRIHERLLVVVIVQVGVDRWLGSER
jgi:hypothetical protein